MRSALCLNLVCAFRGFLAAVAKSTSFWEMKKVLEDTSFITEQAVMGPCPSVSTAEPRRGSGFSARGKASDRLRTNLLPHFYPTTLS